MKRLVAILLALIIFFIGSGAAQWLHELEHAMEDAAQAKSGAPVEDHHDESNCQICAQLHMPMISGGWVLLLFLLGLLVAFLEPFLQSLVSQRALLRIDCRGPPAC
jgi:hypothetical protein